MGAGVAGWLLIVGITNGVSGNGTFSQLAGYVPGVTEVINDLVKSCLEFLMRTGGLTYKLRCRGGMERWKRRRRAQKTSPSGISGRSFAANGNKASDRGGG
jgi:hypothetical protein